MATGVGKICLASVEGVVESGLLVAGKKLCERRSRSKRLNELAKNAPCETAEGMALAISFARGVLRRVTVWKNGKVLHNETGKRQRV